MKRRLSETTDVKPEADDSSSDLQQTVASLVAQQVASVLLAPLSGSRGFGRVAFASQEQQSVNAFLHQKLGKDSLARRPGPGGRKLTYIESCKAIELANRAFGFNGWSCHIVECKEEFKEKKGDRWSIAYSALVRIELKDGTSHEDVGFASSDGQRDLGAALEQAKKASISDARKRALRLFGEYLGNSCYDREHIKEVNSNKPMAPLAAAPNVILPGQVQGNGIAARPPQPAAPMGQPQQNQVRPQQQQQQRPMQPLQPVPNQQRQQMPPPPQPVQQQRQQMPPPPQPVQLQRQQGQAPQNQQIQQQQQIPHQPLQQQHGQPQRQQHQLQQTPHQSVQQQNRQPQQQQQQQQATHQLVQQQQQQWKPPQVPRNPAASTSSMQQQQAHTYSGTNAITSRSSPIQAPTTSTTNGVSSVSNSSSTSPFRPQPQRWVSSNAPPPPRLMASNYPSTIVKAEHPGAVQGQPKAQYNMEDLSLSQFDYDPNMENSNPAKRLRS